MQYPNQPIVKILAPAIEVQQLTPPVGRQPHRQGIDGEVATMEVLFDAAALHGREGCGMLVELGARGHEIERIRQPIALRLRGPEQVLRQDPLCRAEPPVAAQPPPDLPHQFLGQPNGIPLHHKIDIEVGL